MTTFKRSLAMLLCALMLLSATPLTALAEEVGTGVEEPAAAPQSDVVTETETPELGEDLLVPNGDAAPLAVADSDVAKIGDTGYATLADAVTAAAAGDTIVLLKDSSFSTAVTVTKKITITAESAVTVTKTGANEWLLIKAGGDVTLEGPITVVGNTKYGALLEVAKSGILTMNAGVTLKDNQTNETKVGAGVNISEGTFAMNGGTIQNCGITGNSKPSSSAANNIGGAVRVYAPNNSTVGASFVMNGGTIKDCYCYYGGAVGVVSLGSKAPVSATINGGTISSNSANSGSDVAFGSAKGEGGAFYIYNSFTKGMKSVENATVTINGGTITENTANKYGTLGFYTSSIGTGYGGKYYIYGGTISGNFVGSGSNNAPGSFYGNGIHLPYVGVNGATMLTIGGNAVIDDEIHLKSSTGNYFEILDNFTGSVKVYSQAGGTGSTPAYGTLVAKQVSSTGVASTATKEIAGKITAVYGQSLDENGKVYEHPVYDIVLGTNADEYVLGAYSTEAPSYTVTVNGSENGTVTANPTEGEEGTEVTLTITPDEGYELASLTVTDASGAAVTVTDNKFTMPASNVTVSASFTKVETAPELPNGNNVTTSFVTMICDTDASHEAVTVKWQSGTIVYPTTSTPVWDEELGAWTIGVRIDMIGTKYVWPHFEEKYNDIDHDLVASDLVNTEYSRIDTKLKWDETKQLWVTLDEKPIEVHLTCQTKPEAPSMGYYLNQFQIKVVGEIDGEEKVWASFLDKDSIQVGEVKGNRVDGFTVDVTVSLANGDSYLTAWLAKYASEEDYVYDWSKTEATVTFTMKYTGDTTGTIHDTPASWAAEGDNVYTAYVRINKEAPELPNKYGYNVTDELITIICDSDHEHHPNLTGKWYSTPCKIYPSNSQPVWNSKLNAWTIGVRIQSLSTFYVDKMTDTYNNIWHDLVDNTGSVEDKMIVTTLMWDEAAQLWVPTEAIELHTACKTVPDAPSEIQLKSYQIAVHGLVNGEEKNYTTNIPVDSMTVGEVYGSREEGFSVDVTVTLEEGDIYITNWIAQRNPGVAYVYDWDKTPTSVTFTLTYNGDLNGTLYGNRHGSNTNYDWIIGFKTNGDGSKSPMTWGAVADAYVKEDIPAPYYDTITDELVTVICDSDGDRHAPVTGSWYKQHSKIYSDTMAWDADLGTWTIQIRIDGLYTMYVSKLEKANGNTAHTIVGEDTKSIFTSLKWDYAQKLWVPVEDIEIHTVCRTAPLAPVYEHQLDSYQIKVYGDVDGDGVFGELKQDNKGVGEVYTTYIPEDGYTISEVYGSREEGFFVDVTVTLSEGDIYQKNWIAQCNPGFFYNYDWEKTPQTVTFTLVYTGDLNGTLHGDRYASNTNVDWVLSTTGKDFGVVAEAYVNQVMSNVQIVIYRNGNVSDPYKTISLGKVAKGTVLDLTELDIADYYTSANGFKFDGWFNDGKWNQYKAGKNPAGLEELTVNGWTNIICMVTNYEKVVVRAVTNGDKDNAEVIFSGKALKGENLISWLEANVNIPAKTGYTVDKWYNWDWYGHKHTDTSTVNGWTNVYITYSPITYTIKYNAPDGKYVGSEPNSGSNWMLLKNAYTYDAPVTLHDGTGFQRTGYKLIGWTIGGVFYELGETVEVNFTKVQSGTVQAYAVWEVLPLNVYYYVDGELVSNFTITDESEILAFNVYDNAYFTAPEKTGYTLLCWYEKAADIGNTNKAEPNAAQNFVNKKVLRLYGAFEANQYTLTLDPTGGKVDPTTITVTYDAAIGELPEATRSGYIFDGWVDAQGNEVTAETIYTVAGDSTISAKWIRHPGSSSGNVTKELFTIQCTVNHDHAWLCNWFGSHVTLVKDSVKWDDVNNRWVAQAKIGSSMLSQINSTQPKKNYFGGITHHYDEFNFIFDLYYDPNFTGLNSQNKEVTGMWLPVEKYVVDVYCYTEPSMPDVSKITSKALWVRETNPAFKSTTYTTKYTIKQLLAGTYSLSQMYTENGKFYVDLTITDINPYIEALGAKNGKEYVIGDWKDHCTAENFKFKLTYTGSTTDYKQDGTGWSVDASSYASSKETNNGKSLWLTEQFTVTYTDGLNGTIFADTSYTVPAFSENGGTKDDWADFSATSTPAFEVPERTGYTFAGWTPEVPETVTADAVYTAAWNANTYTVTFNPNGGEAIDPITVTFDAKYGRLPSSALTGFSGGDSNWYLVDENGNVTDTKITKLSIVTTARDHQLFVVRKVLAPTLKITLEVPGAISNDYKYYVPGNSTRILTVTVNNANPDALDYTYQWYKDGTLIEGETESVLTLPGNVSDTGTYKVVVTAKLKDGSTIVVTSDTASAEKEQEVKIMRASNTLRYNANFGETPETSDSYFGSATATVKGGFARTGYTLTGWNTKADGTGDAYVNGDTVSFPGDNGNGGIVLELYAQWKANEYTVTFNTNGGPAAEPKVVTFDSKYGTLPTSSLTGLSSRKTDWYLVDENGNVTDIQIKNTSVVSVARDHTLFLKRDVLAPTLKITLEVPGAISDDYKYYVPGNSTRVLTVTVNNMNADVLDYTYAWYKDGTLIEGETEAVLTLPGNVSDTGTYKVVVTAKLKDGTGIVAMNDTASAEKEQQVKIMHATNTLYYDANGGEGGPSSNYTGGTTISVQTGEPTRVGYTFAGWNTKADGTGDAYKGGDTFTFVDDNGNGGCNVTLYAQWTGNTYEITLNANGGSFPVEEGDPAATITVPVTYGSPVGELPTPVLRGHTFAGWLDENGNPATAETVYSTVGGTNLTAQWTANTYTITFDVGQWGSVDPEKITVTYGQPIGELPVPVLTNWNFANWDDPDGKMVTAQTVYDYDSDIVLKAVWWAKQVDPNSPQTSDMTTIVAMSALLISAAGLIVLILADRKRRAAK